MNQTLYHEAALIDSSRQIREPILNLTSRSLATLNQQDREAESAVFRIEKLSRHVVQLYDAESDTDLSRPLSTATQRDAYLTVLFLSEAVASDVQGLRPSLSESVQTHC